MKEISPWRIRHFSQKQDIEPEYTYASQENEIHLSDYWNILVKRRRIIIILFLVVFALGAYFPLSATKLYTASATLKIEPQNPQVTGVVALQPLDAAGSYYPTQFALLKSRRLAARVINELGLESNKTFTSSPIVSPNPFDHLKSWVLQTLGFFGSYVTPLTSLFRSDMQTDESVTDLTTLGQAEAESNVPLYLIDSYLGFVTITPILNTRLVNVQVTTPHPGLSQALANAHVQSFLRMSLDSRFNLTKEAREFLNQKITELRQKLERSETALNNFRRTHGVVSVEKGENIVVDRLVDLNRQLTAARAQRIEAESLYRTVENKKYQDLAEVMKQGLVQQLKSNVATLEAERARTATIFKPDHPRFQDLSQQIAAARQAFNSEIANVVRGIQSSYAAALAKERGLQGEADKQQQDALKLKELGVHYTVLQEEVTANQSLYQSVLKRLNETNVSNDIAVSNMEIAEKANKPLSPSSPNIPLYLLVSMISGLFFGVGVAFLQECVDSTLTTPDDVWRSTALNTLGVVPDLKFLNQSTYNGGQINRTNARREESSLIVPPGAPAKELMISHSPISIMSESYRTIRTSLLLSQAEKPPQVVLLTSPEPGEGKTVTTLNLGIALAQNGDSVLIIDGDMRQGRCHTRLGMRNNKGLSNVLTGSLSLEEGIQRTSVSGLSLLSRGVLPPNPAELLGSSKMREILQELRQSFKFILIDSPPVIAVSDAAVLSTLSDGVLLVFHGQKTSTASAQKSLERLGMVRAPVLGVILNGVNLDNPHYSYYRTYSSYYVYEPNGDQASTNGKNRDAVVQKFDTLSKIAQFWGAKGPLQAKDRPESTADSKSLKDHSTNNCENTSGVSSEGVIDEADILEPVSTSPTVEKAPSSDENPRAPLSEESCNRLLEALTTAIGPIAPLVVREQIAALGESWAAFPKRRLEELVGLISQEILNEEIRSRFRQKMSEEIRSMKESPNNIRA